MQWKKKIQRTALDKPMAVGDIQWVWDFAYAPTRCQNDIFVWLEGYWMLLTLERRPVYEDDPTVGSRRITRFDPYWKVTDRYTQQQKDAIEETQNG